MQSDKLKQQIEAKYEEKERYVETKQYAGQMTIAFCVGPMYCTLDGYECPQP